VERDRLHVCAAHLHRGYPSVGDRSRPTSGSRLIGNAPGWLNGSSQRLRASTVLPAASPSLGCKSRGLKRLPLPVVVYALLHGNNTSNSLLQVPHQRVTVRPAYRRRVSAEHGHCAPQWVQTINREGSRSSLISTDDTEGSLDSASRSP